jgi:hypothetical protein
MTEINLAQNGDFKGNFYTPFIDSRFDPPRVRENLRVPNLHWLKFQDDTSEPRLDGQAADAKWLAPEGVFRSGDVGRFPFTERLPDAEIALYLTDESPVVYHLFKGWGIQWWELGQTLMLPAGRYRYSIECYPDVYFGEHRWADDPLAWECRLRIVGGVDSEWASGRLFPFGKWTQASRIFTWLGGACQVSLEVRARWGVDVVGTFMRKERLVKLNDLPAVDWRVRYELAHEQLQGIVERMEEDLQS